MPSRRMRMGIRHEAPDDKCYNAARSPDDRAHKYQHHSVSTATEATTRVKDDLCVSIVDKSRNEMSKSEWNTWIAMWHLWRNEQPEKANHKMTILSKFPRVKDEAATTPGVSEMTEEQMLETIKKLVVKDSNVIRQRQAMQSMKQSYDETVSNFAKRLTAAAKVCDFIKEVEVDLECEHGRCIKTIKVPYDDLAIRDTFFLGLYDKELVEKLCLQFKKKVPGLAEIIAEAQGIEASRIDAMKHHTADNQIAAISTYKQQARMDRKDNKTNAECECCGKRQARADQKDNKANTECEYCGRNGHVASECRQKKNKNVLCNKCNKFHRPKQECANHQDKNSARSPSPTATTTAAANCVSIAQQSMEEFDGFIFNIKDKVEVDTVPRIRIQMSANELTTDSTAVSNKALKTTTVDALADSGASKCLVSESLYKKMGGTKKQLSPSMAKLKAANGSIMKVLGEISLKLTIADSPTSCTMAMVSVAQELQEDMILSRSACIQLKVLPPDFPRVIKLTGNGQAGGPHN